MGRIEQRWRHSPSRRKALASLAGLVAGSPLVAAGVTAQLDPRPLKDHKRLPGLDEMLSAFDFEPVMFANVPLAIYDYTAHGDGSEFTLRRNREAFDWVDLVPGRPIDRSRVDLSCEVLGTKMKYPIMVAPTAAMVPLHPEGEAGMHRAATASSNTPMIVSQNTSLPIDRIAAAATGPLWWQLYPYQPQSLRDEQGGPRPRASRRLHGGRGHRRSAGVVLRAHGAGSESRRHAAHRRARRRARRSRADLRAGAVSPVDGQALVHVALSRRGPADDQGAARREGHSDRRGRHAVPRARRRRDHRVQSRRPLDGLRPLDARSAAGNRGGRERPDSRHHRQRVPARRRHPESARARGRTPCSSAARRGGRSAPSGRPAPSGCWR